MANTKVTSAVIADGAITPSKIASGDFYFDTDTLYIDSTNNRVGIGNSSPATKLEILDANGVGLRFGDIAATPSSQTAGYIGMSTSAYSGNNGDLVLIPRTSSASRILLMEGEVGIGTTSPASGTGTPLTLSSSTGYVGLRLNGTGSYANDWDLYASGDGAGLDFFGVYDRTNLTYRLVATNTGNVGIGTSSPTTNAGFGTPLLEVRGSSGGSLLSTNSTTSGEGAFTTRDTGINISMSGAATASTGNNIIFRTGNTNSDYNSTERMRIMSDGRVGIGTSSPVSGAALDVQPYLRAGNLYVGLDSGNRIEGGNGQIYPGVMSFIAGASGMDINQYVVVTGIGINLSAKLDSPTGDWYTNDGSVSSLSDERVKTDITDLSDGLEIVKQLRPVTFKYNDNSEDEEGRKRMGAASDKVRYGFIAQEVEQVAPQYVETGIGYINNEEVDDFKSLSTTRMIPMLFKAIQEQQTIIDDLKARIETLENA